MSGFQSPNYTQTPNDFFDMLPDMEHSEANITLVMIRQTFGFHRDGFKMGINKLAKAAGLSRNAAKDGAESAERRGTFRRVNPASQGEAEWELVVDQPVTTPSTNDSLENKGGQPVTTPHATSDPLVGVKEKLKKEDLKNKNSGEPPMKKEKKDPNETLQNVEWDKHGKWPGLQDLGDTYTRLTRLPLRREFIFWQQGLVSLCALGATPAALTLAIQKAKREWPDKIKSPSSFLTSTPAFIKKGQNNDKNPKGSTESEERISRELADDINIRK